MSWGTRLSSILFALHHNDPSVSIQCAEPLVYANDVKVCWYFNRLQDSQLPQVDINCMVLWRTESIMSLTLNKCKKWTLSGIPPSSHNCRLIKLPWKKSFTLHCNLHIKFTINKEKCLIGALSDDRTDSAALM